MDLPPTTPHKFILEMDRYERDNLLALLHLIYAQAGGPPLGTGDWAGQLYWKLAEHGFDPHAHSPNASPVEQLKRLQQWASRLVECPK